MAFTRYLLTRAATAVWGVGHLAPPLAIGTSYFNLWPRFTTRVHAMHAAYANAACAHEGSGHEDADLERIARSIADVLDAKLEVTINPYTRDRHRWRIGFTFVTKEARTTVLFPERQDTGCERSSAVYSDHPNEVAAVRLTDTVACHFRAALHSE